MEYETRTNRCPHCKRLFNTLADEYGSHPCPYCGWFPDSEEPEEDE